MEKYKSILISSLLIITLNMGVNAQNYKWKTYRSYQYATLVEANSNYVFATYNGALKINNTLEQDGSLLIYSPEEKDVRTFSPENGLHDSNIVLKKYDPETACLIIVYQNANIDLLYGLNDITNIPELKDRTDIQNKTINNIDVIEGYAYIAGGFGALILDLKKREIKSDFKWNINITSFCLWNGFLYASTEEGLLKADPKSNLQDRNNWTKQTSSTNIKQLLLFKDHLISRTSDRKVIIMDTDFNIRQLDEATNKIRILNDELVLLKSNQIFFYSDLTQKTHIQLIAQDITSTKKDTYWLANGELGITEITKKKDSNEYQILTPELKINSPIRNYVFYMNFIDNKLLITGGSRQADRRNITGTFMVYEKNKWFNLDNKKITKAIQAQLGNTESQCKDLMSAVVDPRDPNHFFVSGWGEGVYELQRENSEFNFIKLHTYNNSSLQSTSPNNPNPSYYVRVDGLVYDKNANLYMTNTNVTDGIIMLTNKNLWQSFYGTTVSIKNLNQLIITRNNLKWGNIFRKSEASGVYVYNDNNTIENKNDDEYYFSRSFYDQNNRSFSANEYLCLTEDMNGTVWVGTSNGPIYFTSATQVKDNRCNRLIGTDQYGEGFFILDGIKIQAIAVDGANRKWMASDGNGLFMVDQTGGETVVKNFNTKNSLILSDKLTALAIDQKSGEIFIGTDKGVCSYQGDAIEGKTDYSNVYAYPNPVYPLRNSEVVITGLMQSSTVKITDVAGNLIKTSTSAGGQYTWDCMDIHGETVKPGIYLVFATSSDGSEGIVTKIMVMH